MTSSNVQDFLNRLNGVKQSGPNSWQARCPCRNDDDNPSLSVKEDVATGNVLVACHRGNGCDFEEICKAANMPPEKMFAQSGNNDYKKGPQPQKKSKSKKLVKTYKYYDENGELAYEKLRYITDDGKKTFLQRRPNPDAPGDYTYTLDGIQKILYNLPAVIRAVADGTPIWVVEGEKDADTLNDMGYVATTGPSGAGIGKWEPQFTEVLRGAQVEIVADNDDPGITYASHVFHQLRDAGCNVGMWIAKEGKDVTDHFKSGHTVEDLVYVNPLSTEEVETEVKPIDNVFFAIEEIFQNKGLSDTQKVARAQAALSTAVKTERIDGGRLVAWDDFLKEDDKDNYEWVIPGLVERKERVIVVAAEGVGKTMLARQIAIMLGFGLHPFTYQKIEPMKTLMIDLENPERIIRRTTRNIYKASYSRLANNYGVIKPKSMAHLLLKPSGVDLLSVADQNYVIQQIEMIRPDMILFGPLYKSYIDGGGRSSDQVAIEVAKFLDMVRDAFNCALWIEHHAPLGTTMATRELRPFGSSVWSRWPEFGISLQPDAVTMEPYNYEVRHFRGARDERAWPTKIKRGNIFPFEVVEFAKVG